MRNAEQFALERRARAWSLQFYEMLGYTAEEVKGEENRAGDIILRKDGREILIEEKTERRISTNMVFELVQDVDTRSWGWIYDVRANRIVYIFWSEILGLPFIVYRVDWPRCKAFCLAHLDKYQIKVSRKGWGLTLFACIPWAVLESEGIATVLYKSSMEERSGA